MAGILWKDIPLSWSERLEHPTIAQITIVVSAILNFNHVMKTLYRICFICACMDVISYPAGHGIVVASVACRVVMGN